MGIVQLLFCNEVVHYSLEADTPIRHSKWYSLELEKPANLSDDQEQVPLLQHVVHEHKIEKKPKISECFIVTIVEQPRYDYLDVCEDKWLNNISASINKPRILLPRIK